MHRPVKNLTVLVYSVLIAAMFTVNGFAQAQDDAVGGPASDADKFYRTGHLAIAVYEAGDKKNATFYAESLLKQADELKTNWNYGNAVHIANLVLGRIALGSGDIEAARSYLTKAGQTPGSPQLNTFGPDMAFAREMLAKGERQAVLDYFKLCAKFWEKNNGKLADWATQVENGEKPNFGPNLIYFFNSKSRSETSPSI